MYYDYGHYGKGTEGYIQYMEAFESRDKRGSGGGRKPGGRGRPGCFTIFIVLFIFLYCLYKTGN